jgi:hypothetical protein
MVAILLPTPDHSSPTGTPVAGRPSLTLVQGGRADGHMAAVYLRRRVAAAVIVLVVLVGAVAVGRAAIHAVTPRTPSLSASAIPPGAATVVVRPGDSFWSIARRLQPTGDVRLLVDRLSAEHANAPLQPGDVLAVPR